MTKNDVKKSKPRRSNRVIIAYGDGIRYALTNEQEKK